MDPAGPSPPPAPSPIESKSPEMPKEPTSTSPFNLFSIVDGTWQVRAMVEVVRGFISLSSRMDLFPMIREYYPLLCSFQSFFLITQLSNNLK